MNDLILRASDLTSLLRRLATDTNPGATTARGTANDLIDEIDELLRGLHVRREGLVAAARAYDDATNRRVDALLQKRRSERPAS